MWIVREKWDLHVIVLSGGWRQVNFRRAPRCAVGNLSVDQFDCFSVICFKNLRPSAIAPHGFLGSSGTFYMAAIVKPLNCALEFLLHRDSPLWQRKVTSLSLPIPERADVQQIAKICKRQLGWQGTASQSGRCVHAQNSLLQIMAILGQYCPGELQVCMCARLFPLHGLTSLLFPVGLLVQCLLISLLCAAWVTNAKSKMGTVLADTKVLSNSLSYPQ